MTKKNRIINKKLVEVFFKKNIKDLLFIGQTNKKVKIDVGKLCNASCNFCYYYDRLNEKKGLPLKLGKEIILELNKLGAEEIEFSGGEPLIYKHLIELLQFTKTLGMSTSIVTNCSNTILLEKIINLDILDGILISVQGYEDGHNKIVGLKFAWEKIQNIIKNYHQRIKIRLNTVVTAENYNQLFDLSEVIIPYIIENKIYQWNLLPVNFWDNNKENSLRFGKYKRLHNQIQRVLNLLELEINKSPDLINNLKIPSVIMSEQHNIQNTNTFKENKIVVRYAEYCLYERRFHKYIRNHIHHLIDVNDWNTYLYPEDVKFNNKLKFNDIYPNKLSFENIYSLPSSVKEDLILNNFRNRLVQTTCITKCLNCEFFNICDGFKILPETEMQIFDWKNTKKINTITLDETFME